MKNSIFLLLALIVISPSTELFSQDARTIGRVPVNPVPPYRIGLDQRSSDNYEQINQSYLFQQKFLLPNLLEVGSLLGSPYLHQDFKEGTVTDRLAQSQGTMDLRYNIYNDLFEVYNYRGSKDTLGIQRGSTVVVESEGIKYYYKNFLNLKEKSELGYLGLLGNLGDKKVYVRMYQEIKMPRKARTTLEIDLRGAIRNRYNLVVQTNEALMSYKLNKRNFFKFLNNADREKVNYYLDENNMKLNTYDDIIKALEFLETNTI